MSESKPTVRYSHTTDHWPDIAPGRRACVYIVEPHHTLGRVPAPKWVHTSEVVSVSENGDFETLNTLYVKVNRSAV